MTSFLPQIRTKIGKAFKSRLLSGTLSREGQQIWVNNKLQDSGVTNYTVEGFPDNYTQMYRTQSGIPEGDSRIILIAANSQVAPQKDDTITFSGFGTFKVRSVMTDPAMAHYDCQVFEA